MKPFPPGVGCTVIALALAAAATAARAQPRSGVPYGSRDARQCAVRAPRGAPTAAQAAQAVICDQEGIKPSSNGPGIHLVEQIRVEVGRGHRYEPGQYVVGTDLDPRLPVYPIRGTLITYSCVTRQHRETMGQDPNRNCTVIGEPTATGICYTSGFGQLVCGLSNDPPVSIHEWRYDIAPPRL